MVTNLEAINAGAVSQTAVPAAMMTVEIFSRAEDVRPEWQALSSLATASPYQSYHFLSIWADTIGREQRLEPLIALVRDPAGRPLALLPFVVDARGPLRIATFLGGRESNFCLGLFHPDARFSESDMRSLLLQTARQAPDGVDLYYLRNQPKRFDGFENPLAFKCTRPSASSAYGASLPQTQEELAARLSRDTRKKLRKKEAKLAELGDIRYEHCATGKAAQEILQALISQKSARFADMGIDGLFEGEGMRSLARQLIEVEGEGAMELHALRVDDRIVATYAGFVRGGRFSAMLNSFDAEDSVARSSPGDLLLHALMRNLVSRGMTHFDLGAGEARYKNSVCEEKIELCDALIAATWKGALAAPLLLLFLLAKRRVKQSPLLMQRYAQLRKLLRGRSAK